MLDLQGAAGGSPGDDTGWGRYPCGRLPRLLLEARMTFGMVVLAGGIGRRIGRPFPKQFLLLGGKPLIVHVLEKARAIPALERIVITCP